MEICTDTNFLEIMRIILIVIRSIFIVVPVILIVLTMIDFFKAVTDGEDGLKKSSSKFITRFISAIVMFFIPTIVMTIFNMTGNVGFIACINNANKDQISELNVTNAEIQVEKTKATLDYSDYEIAIRNVNKIKDEDKKEELMADLNKVKGTIELKTNVDNLKSFYSDSEYQKLYNEVVKLPDSALKTDLLVKLKDARIIGIKEQIQSLKSNYNEELHKTLYNEIMNLDDEAIKQELLALLESVGVGRPLNVQAGTFLKNDKGLKYYIVIPEGATTNMPLITYLEGDNPSWGFDAPESRIFNGQPTKSVINGTAYSYRKFIYIYPAYSADDHDSFRKVKSLMDYVCEEYKCNKDKIIVTGVSNGAVASFWLGYEYPKYFSAVVPMCGPAYAYYYSLPNDLSKAGSFVGTSLWSMTAGRGDYSNYESKSKKLIDKIHEIDPNSKALYACKVDEFKSIIKSELRKEATSVPNITAYKHCTISAYYGVPELWEWMIKQ